MLASLVDVGVIVVGRGGEGRAAAASLLRQANRLRSADLRAVVHCVGGVAALAMGRRLDEGSSSSLKQRCARWRRSASTGRTPPACGPAAINTEENTAGSSSSSSSSANHPPIQSTRYARTISPEAALMAQVCGIVVANIAHLQRGHWQKLRWWRVVSAVVGQ